MAEQEKNSFREPSSLQKFFGAIKDYKELAAAIAFFVGGVLWVFGYFATKEELRGKTERLNCLLEAESQLLEGKLLAKGYREEMMEVRENLKNQGPTENQGPTGVQFSERERKKITALEQRKDDLQGKIHDAENQVTEAQKTIQHGRCDK